MIKLEDLNMSEKELDELQDLLNNRKKKKQYQENLEAIQRNRKYIGKCFTDKKGKYIRVLSSKSSNIYHLECMCFSFPVEFSEDYKWATRIFSADNIFSAIDFEGIHVEDYPLLCNDFGIKKKVIDGLTEITQEEYFQKMNEYITELQEKIKDEYFDTSKTVK